MLQRIQTLYLLLIVIAAVVLLWQPVLSFTSAEDAGVQRYAMLSAIHGLQEQALVDGAEFTPDSDMQPLTLNGTWGLLVTTVLIALLALVDIFLFKHRLLQARLNIVNVVLCLGYYALLALYVAFVVKGYETIDGVALTDAAWYLNVWAGLPLVCIVLSMMATRRILKDEALVRAADRLR